MFAELEAEALGRQPPSSNSDTRAETPLTPAASGACGRAGSFNPWASSHLDSVVPALPGGFLSVDSGDAICGPADMSGSDESCDTGVLFGGGSGSGGRSPRNGVGAFNPLESYGLLPTSLAEQVRCPERGPK